MSMIAALIVTCFLGAGEMYAPPEGWTVQQVGIVGTRNICNGTSCFAVNVLPIERSFVVIRRPVKASESIEMPPGCQGLILPGVETK